MALSPDTFPNEEPVQATPFRLQVDQIRLSRGETTLFADLSFDISPGQLIWVNGGNGMGKTSLLRVVAGFLRPDAGQITYQRGGIACAARDIIGFQGHNDAFKPAFSAVEALRFWADIYDHDWTDDGQTSPLALLQAVGLIDRANVPCGSLSAGQKRRLALARLMLSQKPLWVMDEPTAAMDVEGVALIHGLVERHIAVGGSAIIASHNPAQSMHAQTRRMRLSAASSKNETQKSATQVGVYQEGTT